MNQEDYIKLDQQYVWHPFSQEKIDHKRFIEKAEGVYLYDSEGNKFIDAISSWWVNIHGHSNTYIANKISEQALTCEHIIFAGFTHKPAIELCSRLSKHLPKDINRLFFSDNGSTAVEVALKMATQFWFQLGIEKKKIIAFNGAYHGDTVGAMSVGDPGPFNEPFNHLLFDVIHIDPPTLGNEENALRQLKKAINSNSDIAAFIYEPMIQGTAGMITQNPEILNSMLTHAKANNIILIADEVMTGFGRTGKWFASEYCETKPDIMCLSKGITGGTMAMGVTACHEKFFHCFFRDERSKCFLHGHSYTANPIACAAALASLDIMEKQETWNNIKRIERNHCEIADKFKNHSKVKVLRKLGTMLSIECKTDENSSYFNQLRDRLYDFFMNEGVLLRPLGNIIYILPPYCMSEEELEKVYKVIFKALDQIV